MPDLSAFAPPDALLHTLLDVSLTGVILFRPLYAAEGGEITDLAYVYLNPAAQRMLNRPECPTESFRTLYPHTGETGIFAFYRDTYRSGQPGHFNVNYQHDGLDNYFHLAAERSGALLVVSFTDTADHTRTPVELALRESQTAAAAAAEATAQQVLHVTESLPSTSFTVDQTGQIRYISPQWYTYTGMAPGADITETWPQFIHPDDLPAIAGEYGVALAEGRAWRYEFRLRGADGHYRWFASQGLPEPLAEAEAAGRPRQWFGSNLDVDDLKQAQRQLEEKDQLLTSILSSLPASVVTFVGEELRYGFFNAPYQRRMQGRAVLGSPVGELFPEAEEQGFLALMREVLHTGVPYHEQEAPAYTRNPHTGQRRNMHLDRSYLPLRHGQQAPHAVLGFAVDVTDRVLARRQAEAAQAQALAAAEQAMAEREAFYQVFEQTPALITILRGPDHRFAYFNAAQEQVFPGRQLRGAPLAQVLPDAATQGFVALLDRVYATGEPYVGTELPAYLDQPDGRPARLHYFTFAYQRFEEDGAPAGISVFGTDVTEQVLARQQREGQQVQLQELFKQVPVAIGVFAGPDYVVEICNPRLEALWGRAAGAVLQQPVFEAMPEFRDQGLLELLDGVRATGIPFIAHERPVQVLLNGQLTSLHLDFVYHPLRDAQGAVTAVAAVVIDVSEQVAARQHLADANADLTAANEQLLRTNADLDTFIYTASHDLKAPIQNIEGLLEVMRRELTPVLPALPAVPPLLHMMQDSVDRFQRTIAQLTDIVKLQQASAQPPVPVPVAALTDAIARDLAPDISAAQARLTFDTAALPVLVFSEKNLRAIVFNLLSNALKYRHPARPPQVTLRTYYAPTPALAVLEVQDNGLGLTSAQQGRLFGLFERMHPAIEGSGVGLYMVKKIVDNAGGRIEVESTEGEGSVFRVFLPQ